MIRTLLKVSRSFGTDVYTKFRITRAHDQKVALFMTGEATVNDLLSQIKLNFPVNDNLILIGSDFQPSLLGSTVSPEI